MLSIVAFCCILPYLSTSSDVMSTKIVAVETKRCKLTDGCQSRSDWLKDDEWLQCGQKKYPNRCRARCDGYDFETMGPCKPCDKDPEYNVPDIDLPCVPTDCSPKSPNSECSECSAFEECCPGNDGKCKWDIYPNSNDRYLRCLANCGKSGYPMNGNSGSPMKGNDGKSGSGDYGKSGNSGYGEQQGYGGKIGDTPYDGGKSGNSYSGKDDGNKPGNGGYDGDKSSYDYSGKGGDKSSKSSDGYYGKPGSSGYGQQSGYDDKSGDHYKQGMGGYDGGKQGSSGYGGQSGYDGKQGMNGYDGGDKGKYVEKGNGY